MGRPMEKEVDRHTKRGAMRNEMETRRAIVPKPDTLSPASGCLSVGGVTRQEAQRDRAPETQRGWGPESEAKVQGRSRNPGSGEGTWEGKRH